MVQSGMECMACSLSIRSITSETGVLKIFLLDVSAVNLWLLLKISVFSMAENTGMMLGYANNR